MDWEWMMFEPWPLIRGLVTLGLRLWVTLDSEGLGVEPLVRAKKGREGYADIPGHIRENCFNPNFATLVVVRSPNHPSVPHSLLQRPGRELGNVLGISGLGSVRLRSRDPPLGKELRMDSR